MYVAARKVLLDALVALAPHGKAVIIVGAQAVYLRTQLDDLAVAPYTTDGDIALDRRALVDDPELERSMLEAGFELMRKEPDAVEPGIWQQSIMVAGQDVEVPVDLIVPEAVAGAGRRAARLGIHDRQAALCSDRLRDKDAADVVRMMRTASPLEVGSTLAALERHEISGDSASAGSGYLQELFGSRSGRGVRMAQRALRLAMPAAQVATLCISFTERMLSARASRLP